jgi:hypothetical protein
MARGGADLLRGDGVLLGDQHRVRDSGLAG